MVIGFISHLIGLLTMVIPDGHCHGQPFCQEAEVTVAEQNEFGWKDEEATADG